MAEEHLTHGQAPAFVQRLTGCQSALYAYVTTLLGGAAEAQDVLQETNLALWQKASEYDPAQPFLPWAYTFARFQVKAWYKKQARSRLVLDEELVRQVEAEYVGKDLPADRQLEALEECIGQLSEPQRALVDARYRRGEPLNRVAARLGRPGNVVAASLYRIRKALLDCMRAKLAREST